MPVRDIVIGSYPSLTGSRPGYLTIGLDYFRGDPVWKHRKDRQDTKTEPDFDYEAWKAKHIGFADQTVPNWVAAVKERYGEADTKYACVGYCFGAPYVCNSLASQDDKEPVCTAGAFAHPAFLKEHHFRNLQRPLSRLSRGSTSGRISSRSLLRVSVRM